MKKIVLWICTVVMTLIASGLHRGRVFAIF